MNKTFQNHPSLTSSSTCLWANNEIDNEMKAGICTDLLAFNLRLMKSRKTCVRRLSDKGCTTSHRLKFGPLPQNDVSRIA